jgi:hypothetical protein
LLRAATPHISTEASPTAWRIPAGTGTTATGKARRYHHTTHSTRHPGRAAGAATLHHPAAGSARTATLHCLKHLQYLIYLLLEFTESMLRISPVTPLATLAPCGRFWRHRAFGTARRHW